MRTHFTSLFVAFGLVVGGSSCEKDCNRVAQPALYFTLVDQMNKPLLTEATVSGVTVSYTINGGRYTDSLRLSGRLGASNAKYPSVPLLISTDILQYSTLADSGSYQLFLDRKPVGTLRLYPFKKSTQCDTWTYTSGVTFNGKFIPPAGPTNDVYLLPVTP